jgi:hypothetical protein
MPGWPTAASVAATVADAMKTLKTMQTKAMPVRPKGLLRRPDQNEQCARRGQTQEFSRRSTKTSPTSFSY